VLMCAITIQPERTRRSILLSPLIFFLHTKSSRGRFAGHSRRRKTVTVPSTAGPLMHSLDCRWIHVRRFQELQSARSRSKAGSLGCLGLFSLSF
jgi:hypothetical protein